MEEVKLEVTYTNNVYDIHQHQEILKTLIIQCSKLSFEVYFMIKKKDTEEKKTDGNSNR